MRIMVFMNHAGLRGRPPKFDSRPRTASGSLLSAGPGGGDMIAGTTRSVGDQTVATLSAGAYDSSGPMGFVPYEVRLRAVASLGRRSALPAICCRLACLPTGLASQAGIVLHASYART